MLVEKLCRAVEAVIEVAKLHDFGPAMPERRYTVRWWEPTSETSSYGRQEDRSEPAFGQLWRVIEQTVKETAAFQAFEKSAIEFGDREGKFLQPFQKTAHPQALLFEYFRRAAALRVDEALLPLLVTEYQEELRRDTTIIYSAYQVEGFNAETPFSLSETCHFRPVSEEDLDAYGRVSEFGEFDFFGGPRTLINRRDWICEMHPSLPKAVADQPGVPIQEVEDIVAALHLTTSGKCEFTHLATNTKSRLMSSGVFKSSFKTATSRLGEAVLLGANDIESFRGKHVLVRRIREEDRLSALRLPLRRLRLSSARTHHEDHLVDCVIALENLLASDSPQMETTFRFRLRGAAILPADFGNVRERIKLMDRLYAFRSRTVHGGKKAFGVKSSIDEELRKVVDDAERVLRAILLWFIERVEQQGLENLIRQLDDALVAGGQQFASS